MPWKASIRPIAAAIAITCLVAGCGVDKSSPSSPTPTPTPTTPSPTVTAITPTSGGSTGGTAVTITGTNFGVGATVTIGGVAATGVAVVSATGITATTGAGTAGTADVVVTVNGQSGRLTGGFTYQAPVAAALTFTVYNHTAGPMGTFTRTAQSGTDVTLQIANLGALPTGRGFTPQPAISVSGVDPLRIAVREAAQGGRIGNFVAFSREGQVTFKAPFQDRAAYDVFLMNARNGDNYQFVDNSSLNENNKAVVNPKRASTVYRVDTYGGTGPDDYLNNAILRFQQALNPPWMSYGSLTRVADAGDVKAEYNGQLTICAALSFSSPAVFINPPRCADRSVPVPVWWCWLEDLFQVLTYTYHFSPYNTPPFSASSFVVEGPEPGRLSSIGQDLLTYVYVKDPKGW